MCQRHSVHHACCISAYVGSIGTCLNYKKLGLVKLPVVMAF
jgi:hypothetical protein